MADGSSAGDALSASEHGSGTTESKTSAAGAGGGAARAEAPVPADPPRPPFSAVRAVKGGRLHKRGHRSTSGWREHMFLLEGEYLFYYDSVRDTEPRGAVWLGGAEVRAEPDVRGPDRAATAFSVRAARGWKPGTTFNNRTYYLYTNTTGELDEWIALLRRAAGGWAVSGAW